jgi:hypothetical protein
VTDRPGKPTGRIKQISPSSSRIIGCTVQNSGAVGGMLSLHRIGNQVSLDSLHDRLSDGATPRQLRQNDPAESLRKGFRLFFKLKVYAQYGSGFV